MQNKRNGNRHYLLWEESLSIKFKGATLVALTGLLLSASASAVMAQSTTLTLLSAERDETMAPVIAAFEKLHPDVKVEHQSVPFESMNATIEARIGAQDSSIDVMLVDSPRVPAMVSRGYLLKLENLREEIKPVVTELALKGMEVNGEIYTLPFWTSTQLMFYNKDLLDKAGVSYPGAAEADRMTYDQVIEAGKKAQAAGAKNGFVFEQIDRYYQLQPIFESNGAGSGLTGEGNLTPDITNEKWIEGATFYSKLFADGVSPRGIPTNQISATFTAGETAYYVGGPWQFKGFTETEGLKFGVAPVPYTAGGKPVTPTDSWAIGLNPYSAKPELAMELAKFMTLNPEGALASVANNPIPPVNLTAFQTYIDGIATTYPAIGDDAKAIMTYELAKTAVSRPRSVGYVAFEEVMNRTFSDLRNGADVKATLEQGQSELTSALSRIQ